MNIIVIVDGKQVIITPDQLVVNGLTLSDILQKINKLETKINEQIAYNNKREKQLLTAVSKL